MKTKFCTKCKIEKSFSEFNKSKSYKDGLFCWCKNCKSKCDKQYYDKNRLEIIVKQKIYVENNKLKVSEYKKQYRLDNKEYIKKKEQERDKDKKRLYDKKYRETHKKERNEYQIKRKKIDPNFRMTYSLRSRFKFALKNNKKQNSIIFYLGCTIEQLKQHLESQFKEGMSWNNYGIKEGCWSIDHIIPCSAFDHTNEEEINKCWHYTNMQPMWHIENMKKHDKLPDNYISVQT